MVEFEVRLVGHVYSSYSFYTLKYPHTRAARVPTLIFCNVMISIPSFIPFLPSLPSNPS